MNGELTALGSGEPIRESWVDALVRAVDRIGKLRAVPPLEICDDAGGMRISLSRETRFEVIRLTESLSPGGSASAVVQWQDTDTDDWYDAPGWEITVYDPLETFSGGEGTPGWAKFHEQSGRWQIVQLACGPRSG